MKRKPKLDAPDFGKERTSVAAAPPGYLLRLYVTGMTARSSRAVINAKAICEQYLAGRYELQVIDVYQQPTAITEDRIVAIPVLVKQLPLPLRRIVGDLADTEQTLIALDLKRQK